MRTYLIESQTIFLPYLLRILERAGCEIVATSSVVDCSAIASLAPAVVIVDVDYLERSGPTSICRIREMLNGVTLVALSEFDDPLFSASCVLAGASAVWSKNDAEEKLIRALRGVVAKTR